MKRPLTTSFAAPAPGRAPQIETTQVETTEVETAHTPAPSWRAVAPIVAALIAMLEAIETGPRAGPAMKAHRSAVRRQGEAAAALGGGEAMDAVLHQVAAVDPGRAEHRLAFIREAWTGLSGAGPEVPSRRGDHQPP